MLVISRHRAGSISGDDNERGGFIVEGYRIGSLGKLAQLDKNQRLWYCVMTFEWVRVCDSEMISINVRGW
jgi:hypothetical protein